MKIATSWEIRRLQREWAIASNERRAEIEERIELLRKGAVEEQPEENSPKPEPAKPATPAKPAAPATTGSKPDKGKEPEKKPAFPALTEVPHGPYCDYAEIIPMVKIEKKWMTYETYRTTHPSHNIFDLHPKSLVGMYINKAKYEELLKATDDEDVNIADQRVVMSRCARQIPEEYEPVEYAILCGLIYSEAKHDPRVKKLGYLKETMRKTEDCEYNLFDDYFDGVIFNVLHAGMTLEQARKHAENGGEIKEPEPAQAAQPAKPAQNGGVPKGQQPKGGTPKQSGQRPQQTQPTAKKPGQQVTVIKRSMTKKQKLDNLLI